MSEYRVAETRSREDLVRLVQLMFTEGWRCLGGVAITALGDDEYLYAQAMVRAERPWPGESE